MIDFCQVKTTMLPVASFKNSVEVQFQKVSKGKIKIYPQQFQWLHVLGGYIFEVTYCKVSHLWKSLWTLFFGNRNVSYEDVSCWQTGLTSFDVQGEDLPTVGSNSTIGDCLRSIFTIRCSFNMFLTCLFNLFRVHVKLLNSMIPVGYRVKI